MRNSEERKNLVLNSHYTFTNSWYTKTGTKVIDSNDTHTIKFNSWFNTSENNNGLGHITVKWGRNNNAVYTEYVRGPYIGDKEFKSPIQDKRDRNSPSLEKHRYYELDIKYYSPNEHRRTLVFREDKKYDNQFIYNARYSMRVKLSTEELEKLNEKLKEHEAKGFFGLYKEMEMTRCITPLEELATIKNGETYHFYDAVYPQDYMQEFSVSFADSCSELAKREYSPSSYLSDSKLYRRVQTNHREYNPLLRVVGSSRRI